MGMMQQAGVIRTAITSLVQDPAPEARIEIKYLKGTLILYKKNGIVRSHFVLKPPGAA